MFPCEIWAVTDGFTVAVGHEAKHFMIASNTDDPGNASKNRWFMKPLSNIGQLCNLLVDTFSVMANEIQILSTEVDGLDGLIVTFSDGTKAGYVSEELLELRPIRERIETKIVPKLASLRKRRINKTVKRRST